MPRWLDAGRLRSVELDRRGALALHRAVSRPHALSVFVWASRLGGAPLWLGLIALQPLLDPLQGPQRAGAMALLGAVNLVLYWTLKRGTRRPRPFEHCQGIRACTEVPDAFSFPSGHTLHAVAFAGLLSAFFPSLAVLLWCFAALVGLSRIVLGLHYPSDVLAGASLGALTAGGLLLIGRAWPGGVL